MTQTSKNSFFLNKKISKKFELSCRCRYRLVASGQPLVAGRPWAANLWTATSGRGPVARPRLGPNCWSPVSCWPAGCGSTPEPLGQFPFFLKCFFFLPSTFCASGQLLLVGSSTCPPCPYFSLKLQIPITFDL
jgi:hypothetical protein